MAPPSTDLSTEVALLKERVSILILKVNVLEDENEKMRGTLANVRSGFLLLAGIGGFIGWLFSVWDKVSKAWH